MNENFFTEEEIILLQISIDNSLDQQFKLLSNAEELVYLDDDLQEIFNRTKRRINTLNCISSKLEALQALNN